MCIEKRNAVVYRESVLGIEWPVKGDPGLMSIEVLGVRYHSKEHGTPPYHSNESFFCRRDHKDLRPASREDFDHFNLSYSKNLVVTGLEDYVDPRPQAAIDLIYKYTHSDYKTTIDDGKYILYGTSRGTVQSPIGSLPDEVFEEKLMHAQEAHLKDMHRDIAKRVFGKQGCTDIDAGSLNQWCGTFDGIRGLIHASSGVSDEHKTSMLKDLNAAERSFKNPFAAAPTIPSPSLSR